LKIIISGAAGFIGSHAAKRYAAEGAEVIGIDNLSRPGAEENLAWLGNSPGFRFVRTDVRDEGAVEALFRTHGDADLVLHAAGQVAVTTSVIDPRADFDTNALGTLNMLESTRRHAPGAAFFFTSTNKVYGTLDALQVKSGVRYSFSAAVHGVSEDTPLDFHSPYGCSKGSADQYVHDYARIYGLKTVVFRQSCIYGTRQFGMEDQGWVAWFVIGSVLKKPLTIFGDGKQVRDVLWIDDLCELYVRAFRRIDTISGSVYNIGGGPANTLSLLELVDILRERVDPTLTPKMAGWRPGDQRVFVSDIRKAERDLKWTPRIAPEEGVQRLIEWTCGSIPLLEKVLLTA